MSQIKVGFGNLIRSARMGFSVFKHGTFEAWLRIQPHPKGFLLDFRAELPRDVKGEHYCWWEGTDGNGSVSDELAKRSALLRSLPENPRPLPFQVVMNDHGDEVTPNA
jgi:hypothetical protein